MEILITDDSLAARKKVIAIIEELGHKASYIAKNGKDAISLYKDHKPDLVTLDITMPGIDGIETLREIIRFDSEAKVIMITSNDLEEMMFEAFEEGALYYLKKPITKDAIQRGINKVFSE